MALDHDLIKRATDRVATIRDVLAQHDARSLIARYVGFSAFADHPQARERLPRIEKELREFADKES